MQAPRLLKSGALLAEPPIAGNRRCACIKPPCCLRLYIGVAGNNKARQQIEPLPWA